MNLYDCIVPNVGENFTTLLEHKNIKIVRIVSSDKIEPIEYIQEEDEWILLLEGEATLFLKQKEITLLKGENLLIPSKTPHRVTKTQKGTLWLAVHLYK
ncbi:MAG: cupin domain-containing protein [Sulfurovum sp.]|nr:cupin domain-containing protein [Sulfurovum sp.]